MSSDENGPEHVKNNISHEEIMTMLSESVKKLILFRDYYFENHAIEDALQKNKLLEEQLQNTLKVVNEHKDCAVGSNRAKYYYLKGHALNVLPKYSKEAEDLLSKAVKLDPKLVEAWNELGESYWKNNNAKEAENCFNGALNYGKNKISLRSLSMLTRQQVGKNREETIKNIEKGLSLAKEAVQLDPQDGVSWVILGNAHLSAFFGLTQDPKILKQCLSAYSQAEKDIVANTTPDLHYNRGIVRKYEEEFQLALESFNTASLYDPTWDPPKIKQKLLHRYLQDISHFVATCGKMKGKRLQQTLNSIESKQLGPYSGGTYTSSIGQTVKLEEISLANLKIGMNEEKVVLGKVVCSIYNSDKVPFTFCLVDKLGTCVAVTVFNIAEGKGVIIGDSVAIPEPYVTDLNVKYSENEYKFRLIRIETPVVMVVNGKKLGREFQAGIQMSILKKFD